MRLMVLSLVGGAGLLLGSCETMTPEECQVADWRAVGYEDGANGTDRYQGHQKACAKAGVTPNFELYMAGRAQGLRNYCQPQAGFRRALQGASYAGQCPSDLADEYQLAYDDGHRAYQANYALQSAQSRVDSLESDLRDIEHDIDKRERALRDAKTDEEKKRLRSEIDRLDRDRRDKRDELRSAERDIPIYQSDVDRVHYEIGERWGAW